MSEAHEKSLFAQILGSDYASLSEPVRRLHDAASGTKYRGTATVLRGGLLASLIGYFASLPSAREDAAINIVIDKNTSGEIWRRNFSGDTMVSTLSVRDGDLAEQLGLVRFVYTLQAIDGAIVWTVRKIFALGLPLPTSWFRGVSAREYASGDNYSFEVCATLPLIGRLIEYRGELQADE